MSKYSRPKGTFDIIPEESWKGSHRWTYLESTLRTVSRDFGFKEMRTPILESTGLFLRSVGESSDIVTKEMYTFLDKGERSVTMRPEGTAPLLRAFVENGMQQHGLHQKLFCMGPFFRYDRPQAGRYRQFHQYSVEVLGVKSPEQDAEVIAMVMEIHRRLRIQNMTLLLNSIGSKECRQRFSDALRKHFTPLKDQLSADSQKRLESNPMRILDSKDASDQALLDDAPKIADFLSDEASTYFKRVCHLLRCLGIPYTIAPRLVRGLDYYCDTVFEIIAGELGAQNSLGGGGRYDTLLKEIGGPDLPGIGFAVGLERLLLTMEGQNAPFPTPSTPFAFFIGMCDVGLEMALRQVTELRKHKVPCDIFLKGKKVQKALMAADQCGAHYVVVFGEQEIETGHVQVKEMANGKETAVAINDLTKHLERLWREHA